MRKTKKLLALVLALILGISAAPVTALAAKNDEVTYNLLDRPVTVGTGENPYDGDGSYTIRLEDDAFFPYEVQFTWNGKSESRWFMTAEDVVSVGGHDFRVVSERTDPNALTQLGMTVEGKYIPVYPEAKSFTDSPDASPASLLPIREHQLYVYMDDYFPSELADVELRTLFGRNAYPEGKTIMMSASESDYGDDFEIYTGQTIDMSDINLSTYYVELIVGSEDQFDPENERYLIYVDLPYFRFLFNMLQIEGYYEDDAGERDQITSNGSELVLSYDYTHHTADGEYYGDIWSGNIQTNITEEQLGSGSVYVGLSLGTKYLNRDDIEFEVYEGLYDPGLPEDEPTTKNITDEIWNVEDLGERGGYRYYTGGDTEYPGYFKFTVFVRKSGELIYALPVLIETREAEFSIYTSTYLYSDASTANIVRYVSWDGYAGIGTESATFELMKGYPANGTYYYSMQVYNNGESLTYEEGAGEYIARSVVGSYKTLEEAEKAPDITEELFTQRQDGKGGYGADYSKGVVFTIFFDPEKVDTSRYGTYYQFTLTTKEYEEELPNAPRPASRDTYFRMEGAESLNAYIMPYDADSYYYNGFQTVFILDPNNAPVADGTVITPDFYTGEKVTMYLGHDGSSGTAVKDEKTVTFKSGEALSYSAAAENIRNLKNYWVTFLTRQKGAKLFVNGVNDASRLDEETGLPEREVFFTELFDYKHDVFIANIGDEPLTGIKVTLEDAENVVLDDYWTVRGDSVSTLAPFTTTQRKFDNSFYSASEGELQNVAKIRLLPDENSKGDIKGTLVITTDNGGEQRIKLTGISRMPKITTDTIKSGVKFVHYSSLIQTNNMYGSDLVRFELDGGKLPEGITLRPNGELYGVPMETGEFTFTVKAYYTRDDVQFSTREYTMTIAENTDENVDGQVSEGYELRERVPDVITSLNDYNFTSIGSFNNFVGVTIDGKPLTEDQYELSEGSTVITIDAQTFGSFGGGSHTISAEFREGGEDGDMKVAAQNYSLNIPSPGPSVGPGTPSKPSEPAKPDEPSEPSEPSQPQIPEEGFLDVKEGDWFYEDVMWASGEKLMVGIGGGLFAPAQDMSLAMIVTVLARHSGADLTAYTGPDEDILPGTWYTASALWAREKGIIDGEFNAESTVPRGEMAVMLVKYLRATGQDPAAPETPFQFADAHLMTGEENDAFQILYDLGVFKGVGEMYMDPAGATSRSEFAALIHRLPDAQNKAEQS